MLFPAIPLRLDSAHDASQVCCLCEKRDARHARCPAIKCLAEVSQVNAADRQHRYLYARRNVSQGIESDRRAINLFALGFKYRAKDYEVSARSARPL